MIGSEIIGIISELLKLINSVRSQYQDPSMVAAKIAQLREDIAGHNSRVEAALQNPELTKEQKDKALDAIRLSDS